ncbi:hypothetical protein K491DRAFT_677293 [Lophiostoma macrostomum CBS 122681]|uniref:Uncharacterized protein n=1 Tax=Lophiostoma macrostomum CBS 122681 TaxID=1314788 RepID=A0A6A6TEQ5_9PLEO|nr:hypothetical protein K491DRAFT_677293 [Lophiostoma macrostomum CBS 122681]
MTSTLGNDFSLSSRFFKSRGGSAPSAADYLTDAKQVTQLSAVIGNGAHDSALQINGHVADKINNLNFKYLIIPCHCEVVRAVASTKLDPLLPAPPVMKSRLPVSVKRSPYLNTVGPAEISTLRKGKRNITVSSKVAAQPVSFCVIFPRRVQDNFISLPIVKRLGLKIQSDTAVASSILWDSKCFSSNGEFVDLSLSMPGSTRSIARRFHVVEDCPFDMILGAATTEPLG